jgi:hypothetical protein
METSSPFIAFVIEKYIPKEYDGELTALIEDLDLQLLSIAKSIS